MDSRPRKQVFSTIGRFPTLWPFPESLKNQSISEDRPRAGVQKGCFQESTFRAEMSCVPWFYVAEAGSFLLKTDKWAQITIIFELQTAESDFGSLTLAIRATMPEMMAICPFSGHFCWNRRCPEMSLLGRVRSRGPVFSSMLCEMARVGREMTRKGRFSDIREVL